MHLHTNQLSWRLGLFLCILVTVVIFTGCDDSDGGGGNANVQEQNLDPAVDPASDPVQEPFTNTASAGGIPVSGYPVWEERTLSVMTNMVRMDPRGYRDQYSTFTNILLEENYPVVGPVYWNHNLNQSARFHADDMAEQDCFQHDSCDGTTWSTRIFTFYPNAISLWENLAAGRYDPMVILNLLLCEGFEPCKEDHGGEDGHRLNIMEPDAHELGSGYTLNPNSNYIFYYVQDFAGNLPMNGPPLVDGSHAFIDSILNFFLNYHDPSGQPPQNVRLVLENTVFPMILDLGVASAGTYVVSLMDFTGCRSYHFEALSDDGQAWRYPGAGELRTYGAGGCLEDYIP